MVFILEQLDPTQPPVTEVPTRKNLNEFVKDIKARDLYLQALIRFKEESHDKLTSFFQVGGIHGLPYAEWDEKRQKFPADDTRWWGYCTHGSVLFPTWHRPYVALYERLIIGKAVEVAKEFDDAKLRDEYLAVAARLRQPYYDWAAAGTELPLLLFHPDYANIEVQSPPYGKPKSIKNPLFGFVYPEGVRDKDWILTMQDPITGKDYQDERYLVWNQTVRYPQTVDPSKLNPDEPGQPLVLERIINSRSKELRDKVYSLFAFINDWESMSNHTTGRPESLEGIHDLVHVLIGGGGHMSAPEVAGFDPIFWLHHANVDRLLAFWQVLNENTWVTPGKSGDGTLTIDANTDVGNETGLTPFRVTEKEFWTSKQTENWVQAFGYSYPEFKNGTATPYDIFIAVNELYNPNFKTENPPPAPYSHFTPISAHLDKYYLDWSANVTLKLHEFPKSGLVHIFLTKTVPSGDWIMAPERIGDVGVFRNTSGLCENCNQREAAGETISVKVLLTRALLERKFDINNPDVIEKYLKEHLAWRLVLADGIELPVEKVPSLQVVVKSAKVSRPEIPRHEPEHRIPTRFPVREAPTVYDPITNH